MWELDHKEGWTPENWCFSAVVLEKTLDSPLDSKEIQPANHKTNQSWIFIRRSDAETSILGTPDMKYQPIGKDRDGGENWRQEEKGVTKYEMAGWHHGPNGHEFEQAPGDSEGQGSLVCCSPWGHKESTCLSDWTIATTSSLSAKLLIIRGSSMSSAHSFIPSCCFPAICYLQIGEYYFIIIKPISQGQSLNILPDHFIDCVRRTRFLTKMV